MKSSLCLVHKKRTASLGIAGSTLAIATLGLMLALSSPSAQAQASTDVSSATTPAPSPGDWTQFHFDNMQRWNPFETVLGVNNVGNLQLKWKSPIGKAFGSDESSSAVVNGVAYSDSDDGRLYAQNASTGAVLWSYDTGTSTISPVVANGVLYIGAVSRGTIQGEMLALNASTGAKLWSYVTGDFFEGPSPTVVNGVIYVGSSNPATNVGDVIALNATTGAKLWSFATDGHGIVETSPAVVNGVVFVGSNDANVYALNATTGAKLWSFTTTGEFDQVKSSPAVANGVVYVANTGGNVYALNANTGAELWSFTIDEIVQSSPAVANGVVYINADDGNLYALNASTGAKLWSSAFGGGNSSPAVANGVVYVGSNDSNVYALNASTGAKLWSYAVALSMSSPAIVDSVLYIRGGDPSNQDSTEAGYSYAFALGAPATADLFLRIWPSTTVHQGDLLTYTFPVWNLGPENAVEEVLNTQVPAGTNFNYIRISGTPGLGTCTTPKYLGTGQIICHENASMAPNTTWTVRLTVRVTAPAGTVITESAATLADTPDPNMANNAATVSIKVQ
jgi:uncharacterized repeat protein (TIGR01451 family)